jgi:hypothetical protein
MLYSNCHCHCTIVHVVLYRITRGPIHRYITLLDRAHEGQTSRGKMAVSPYTFGTRLAHLELLYYLWSTPRQYMLLFSVNIIPRLT